MKEGNVTYSIYVENPHHEVPPIHSYYDKRYYSSRLSDNQASYRANYAMRQDHLGNSNYYTNLRKYNQLKESPYFVYHEHRNY